MITVPYIGSQPRFTLENKFSGILAKSCRGKTPHESSTLYATEIHAMVTSWDACTAVVGGDTRRLDQE